MKIISVNAGSSSLKFKLLDMPNENVIIEGAIERIGEETAIYTLKKDGKKDRKIVSIPNHNIAVEVILDDLIKMQIIKSFDEIKGVGHRVVQGGALYDKSVLIDDSVIQNIEKLSSLAPLHNPANLTGILAFKKAIPMAITVAVFDTAFHQTMEEDVFMYATPYEWYKKYGVRKYGFHGSSHRFVSEKIAEVEGRKDLRIVVCHIGNGASISAVKNGKCIDTTMGLTPLEGIPMGTRSGNVDPTVLEFVARNENKTVPEIIDILNKKSGYLGITSYSNDSRDLEDATDYIINDDKKSIYNTKEKQDELAKLCNLALNIQYKRVVDYIGSYYILLGGIDVIAFTAGIGENSSRFRHAILSRLSVLGVVVDEETNNKYRSTLVKITTNASKIKSYIVPTDEEIVIARDVYSLIKYA